MPCTHRPKMLTCAKCSLKVCAGCIQLEVHGCAGLEKSAKQELAALEKKLVKVVAAKVAPM
jgi:hypothetical protein